MKQNSQAFDAYAKMATVHERVRKNRHSKSTSRFSVTARSKSCHFAHTHVLQDNEDLTLSAMNPWRTQTLFSTCFHNGGVSLHIDRSSFEVDS